MQICLFKKEKKFKEKEKCGETAVSVTSRYGRFPVCAFLWVKNDGKECVDCSGAAYAGVLRVEGDWR